MCVFAVKPHITRYYNVTVIEGREAVIECHSDGEPSPRITFRKVGKNFDYEEGENVSPCHHIILPSQHSGLAFNKKLVAFTNKINTNMHPCQDLATGTVVP